MPNRVVQSWSDRWDLIVIPCGAKKRDVTSAAHALYSGPYFQACFKTAVMLAASEYRILSAKHGFVLFEQMLDPYDQQFGKPGAIALESLRQQVADQGLQAATKVLGLCAGKYRPIVKKLWPDASFPLDGGIGVQMRTLKNIRNHITVPPSRGYWWD